MGVNVAGWSHRAHPPACAAIGVPLPRTSLYFCGGLHGQTGSPKPISKFWPNAMTIFVGESHAANMGLQPERHALFRQSIRSPVL